MNETLNIYCLPVSGGAFCSQLGLLSEIYMAKKLTKNGVFNGSKDYQPDICLCSSGGNVAVYIALAADWSDKGIERVSKKIKSEIFVKSWLPSELNFLPSWLMSFNGAIFRQGYGAYGLFNAMFTEKTISRVEIWTGTYDVKNNKAQFFCNLKKKDALINQNFFSKDEYLHGSMPLKYLNNDLNSIAEVSVASASIPILVTEQNFSGIGYLDGGIMYPSPIKALSSEICRILLDDFDNNVNFYKINENEEVKNVKNLKTNSKKLRLFYFISYQPDFKIIDNSKKKNDLYIIHDTLSQMLHTNTLQDRNSAIDILRRISICENTEIENSSYYNLTTKKLSEILIEIEKYRHYVLILYPKGCIQVSLVDIKTDDLINKIRQSRLDYGADVWFLK